MSLPQKNLGGGDFQNSLAALLARGNPLAVGAKKPKVIETVEEEKRETIKMDIFADDEDKPVPLLDNVTNYV